MKIFLNIFFFIFVSSCSSLAFWKNEEIDVSRLTSEFNLHFQDADFLSGLSTYFLESGLLKNYNLLYSNPCDKDKKYTVKPHQKLLFSMASPTIKGNLLFLPLSSHTFEVVR